MKKINIPLGDYSYDVLIGYDIFKSLPDEIIKRNLPDKILAVVDKNVLRFHRKRIKSVFDRKGFNVKYLSIEPGENSKSFDMLQKIFNYMIDEKFTRNSLIVAIGGGVVGDLTGFAASAYMRGVNFIQVPTTLLSAVDSSVGGKTGINFNGTKNIIGAFYQPKLVITDLQFLETLPDDEILCGFGEILKYSFLSGIDFQNNLLKNADKVFKKDYKTIENLVNESVNIKKSVVTQDEKEAGLRKILNLGHTFAHAFESVLDFRIKHGEAVIAGIICALRLSFIKGLISEKESESYINFAVNYIRTNELKFIRNAEVYKLMLKDKKNSNGKIKFVLINEPGKLFIDVESEKEEIFSTLNYFKKRI